MGNDICNCNKICDSNNQESNLVKHIIKNTYIA